MIASQALTAWLSNEESQAETASRIEAFRHHWAKHPLLERLRADLRAATPYTAQSLMKAATPFLDSIDEMGPLVRDLVAACQADPFFRPPFNLVSSEIHSGLLLYDSPDLLISLGTIALEPLAAKKTLAAGGSSIVFSGRWTILRFIDAGNAVFSFWEAPAIEAGFAAEHSGRCRLVERRRIRDGETLVVDGRSQSFVIEKAEGDIVCLQAAVLADCAPLSVEYDSKTLEFAGASSTDEGSSRIEMMISMLRVMDRREAAPIIREALQSPHFYTRWHIMREFLALDAEAALPSLKDMAASDPHPEVRAAAAQTLELFFDAEEEESDAPGNLACHA
jgi:hypothetical protein